MMNHPTFRESLSNVYVDYDDIAEEVMRTPLGIELYTGEMVVHLFDREPGWQARYQEAIREDREDKAWARQYLADRADYYRRDPEYGYSQADLAAEAASIREDERRMMEDRERDIMRGLGGIW